MELLKRHNSSDGTIKLLWNLNDQLSVESVLIPGVKRGNPTHTLCVSSQVGCKMDCKFCHTATMGRFRHLSSGEILDQVREAKAIAPVQKLVFMGMGEPLHNLENLLPAISSLLHEKEFNFSWRSITVSTSGLLPGIRRLGENSPVKLAISLNASNDETRSKIMPINRSYPLSQLITELKKYPLKKGYRILFEYVLLKDINDGIEDASRLGPLLRDLPAKINLIPFNPWPGSAYQPPDSKSIESFRKEVLKQGLPCTLRREMGQDILAACGMLKTNFVTEESSKL